MSSRSHAVRARQILDSRGNPTVEVDVVLESGAFGPGGRALGRLDRASRGGRAARRRPSAGAARASRKAVANVQRRDRAGAARARRGRPARRSTRALIELDGTPNKGRLGANAILGVSLATAKAAAARGGRVALPLARRRGGATSARADAERGQRRRARRELARPPGVHDRAGRRDDVRGGAAHRRRGLPRAEEAARTSAGSSTAVGDEGGFAPDLAVERGGDRGDPRGRRRAPGTATGSRSRSTRRRPSSSATAATRSRAARSTSRRPDRVLGGARRAATRSSRSRTALAEDDWDGLEGADRAARRAGAARRRRLFVTNVERLRRGIERGRRPTRSSSR